MGISIASVTAERTAITIEFGGETADCIVKPSAFTPEMEATIVDQRESAAVVELLSRLIESWDVIGEDGAPIVPTAENLAGLPFLFLADVMQQIAKGLTPGKATA